MWDDLIKYSNEGEYGKFVRNFSYDLLLGLNEVEVGKQFAKSELTRSLDTKYDYLGLIRRGQHVTVLYRMRSTKKEGEWLGRLVLGYDKDGEGWRGLAALSGYMSTWQTLGKPAMLRRLSSSVRNGGSYWHTYRRHRQLSI